MNRPSRGDRPSAATRRYVGCFFFPIRIRRSFNATCSSPTYRFRGRESPALLALLTPHPGDLAETLHHLLDFLELLQEQVHFRSRGPASVRNPQPSGAVDGIR